MPATATREEVRRLIESEGAQLVEVLARDEYEWAHLPGALNIPLREIPDRAPRELDAGRPVIAYCHDFT
ncbi:MAG TPA: rhodanese-like domain-containing protein [Acidimicrobiia bacterium]|nr:rhodanese-like domain-containing protein [Acidimicrobiia bacterium]